MIDITAERTHRQIGLAIGQQAGAQVRGSIGFYRLIFKAFNDLEWTTVREQCDKFQPYIEAKFPRYWEEMQGIADGANVDVLDVLALNIRTEIAFGLFDENSRRPMAVYTVNWDWKSKQKPNLIVLRVTPKVPGMDLPRYQMITEAGIIGKIGFNEYDVGTLLNGIRAKGVNPERMPIHFALRTTLESKSTTEALEKIESVGVGGSSHILMGDKNGPIGLECTSLGFGKIPADDLGRVVHANNLILTHEGVFEPLWLEYSPKRTARLTELATKEVGNKASFETILELFKDEQNFPASINSSTGW